MTDNRLQLDTLLKLGPVHARLRLHGVSGDMLDAAHLQRRLGPFMLPTDDSVDEDLALELTSEPSPWPRPGRPPTPSLTSSLEDGAQIVRRDDLEAHLHRTFHMMEGTVAPRLPAIEECLRFLLWLYLTGAAQAGLLVHAATTVKDGVAWCFPAYGGTGKSTLVAHTPGDAALSDDFSLLTLQDGQWHAWSTPFWNWISEADPTLKPGFGAPLGGIGFLRQAPLTRFEPTRADEALTQLMAQTIAFDAFPAASSRTFDLAAELVGAMRRRGRIGNLHLLKGDEPYSAMAG